MSKDVDITSGGMSVKLSVEVLKLALYSLSNGSESLTRLEGVQHCVGGWERSV